MPELPAVDTLHLRNPAALLLGQVSRELSPEDGMFHGNAEHYLSCGASAYNVISAALDLSGVRPRSMLDFGAGAGRVTRWLRAGHPQAAIATTDIRPRDIAFCRPPSAPAPGSPASTSTGCPRQRPTTSSGSGRSSRTCPRRTRSA
ncbi:hypothetical protein [Teichococcus aestuarii]|uniref:hypothetical protein n=1 Tax=Teichococcus aestuarii TaxID=568898 RepID=UPI00360C6100